MRALGCVAMIVAGVVAADDDGAAPDYRVDWATLDGGGGRSSGGAYTVEATVAQADATPLHPAFAGSFSVQGGFWPGLQRAPAVDAMFSDGFE